MYPAAGSGGLLQMLTQQRQQRRRLATGMDTGSGTMQRSVTDLIANRGGGIGGAPVQAAPVPPASKQGKFTPSQLMKEGNEIMGMFTEKPGGGAAQVPQSSPMDVPLGPVGVSPQALPSSMTTMPAGATTVPSAIGPTSGLAATPTAISGGVPTSAGVMSAIAPTATPAAIGTGVGAAAPAAAAAAAPAAGSAASGALAAGTSAASASGLGAAAGAVGEAIAAGAAYLLALI